MKDLRALVYAAWKEKKPPSPATRTLGIRVVKLSRGRAVLEMNVDRRLHNLSRTMHGGVMGDLADAAMGISLATTLKPQEDFTTVEFRISFLRPHVEGPLRAVGTLAKRGRRITFTEATLTNAKNEIVAKSSGTCLLIRG
jgi:uncharacterized protein (TIGR00369 family)